MFAEMLCAVFLAFAKSFAAGSRTFAFLPVDCTRFPRLRPSALRDALVGWTPIIAPARLSRAIAPPLEW
jgi:hypothetical protein